MYCKSAVSKCKDKNHNILVHFVLSKAADCSDVKSFVVVPISLAQGLRLLEWMVNDEAVSSSLRCVLFYYTQSNVP